MRYFMIFQMFMLFFLAAFVPSIASAGGLSKYIWGPPQSDFVRPYLETAKLPHNARWAEDEWISQDWVDARGGNPVDVVNGFYRAGIVTDQYFEDEIPVLEVGQGFIDLGSQDKRRVLAFMDEVFGVTKSEGVKVILVYSHKHNKLLGVFTAHGLQLQ